MKKIAIFVCASFLAGTLPAAVPDGYYDSLSGLSGAALRKAAKAVVRDHKVVSYGTDTWNAFKTTDTHFVNGVNCWWDMYSYDDVSVASGHPGMNIEHSVANSWWGGSKNDAYKDLFHLNPSNSDANSRKSNYPLGEVGTQTWSNGATTIGKPVSGQGGGNNYVYEPCDEYKGDFARVFMYMFTVYDDINWDSSKGWMFDKGSADIFKPWAVELLLKWHRQDPVSDKETARNEAIYGIQRNRNPYIDSPELAEHVWGNMKDKPYQYGGVYVPVDPDPVDPDPVDPDPVDPDPVPDDGIWHLVRSQAEINADDSYVIIGVGKNTSVAMTTRMNSTKYASYFEVEDVEIITDGDRHNYIQELPADVAVLKFIPSGADYKASVNTLAGEQKGWLTCEAVKNMTLAASAAESVPFELSVADNSAVFDFGGNGKMYYNESSPRFTTYTSTGQMPTALYCLKDDTATNRFTIVEDEPAVMIYTIQGVRVQVDDPSLLPAGPYIEVRPGKASRKIMIGAR